MGVDVNAHCVVEGTLNDVLCFLQSWGQPARSVFGGVRQCNLVRWLAGHVDTRDLVHTDGENETAQATGSETTVVEITAGVGNANLFDGTATERRKTEHVPSTKAMTSSISNDELLAQQIDDNVRNFSLHDWADDDWFPHLQSQSGSVSAPFSERQLAPGVASRLDTTTLSRCPPHLLSSTPAALVLTWDDRKHCPFDCSADGLITEMANMALGAGGYCGPSVCNETFVSTLRQFPALTAVAYATYDWGHLGWYRYPCYTNGEVEVCFNSDLGEYDDIKWAAEATSKDTNRLKNGRDAVEALAGTHKRKVDLIANADTDTPMVDSVSDERTGCPSDAAIASANSTAADVDAGAGAGAGSAGGNDADVVPLLTIPDVHVLAKIALKHPNRAADDGNETQGDAIASAASETCATGALSSETEASGTMDTATTPAAGEGLDGMDDDDADTADTNRIPSNPGREEAIRAYCKQRAIMWKRESMFGHWFKFEDWNVRSGNDLDPAIAMKRGLRVDRVGAPQIGDWDGGPSDGPGDCVDLGRGFGAVEKWNYIGVDPEDYEHEPPPSTIGADTGIPNYYHNLPDEIRYLKNRGCGLIPRLALGEPPLLWKMERVLWLGQSKERRRVPETAAGAAAVASGPASVLQPTTSRLRYLNEDLLHMVITRCCDMCADVERCRHVLGAALR